MIDLAGAVLIGQGNGRACYRHPQDPGLVIKVARPGGDARDQNRQEITYLGSLLRRQVPFDHLPRFVGTVPTSLGEGLVCEFIVDADGQPSVAIPRAIELGLLARPAAEALLADLYTYLLRHGIALGDSGADNVLWQRSATGARAVLIDGIGARRPGPKATLRRLVPWCARLALRHQWPRLLANLPAGPLPSALTP
jgi:hypothetical protein